MNKVLYAISVTFFSLSAILLFVNNTPTKQSNTKWVAPKEADDVKNPVKGIMKETEKGKTIFNAQCALCHGPQGNGDGPGGLKLNPRPGVLSSDAVQKQTDGALFWKITNGKPPMASYKFTYSDKQRWDLVNYIRELRKKK
jgi:cytochrome c